MEYNSKSLTREGATMLALADKEEKALIIDEVMVSEKVITAGTDISTLTMADFTSPLTYGISSKVQSDNQFSVKSVITNHWQDSANADHTTNKDFNVALVGVVAHVDGYVDQHVLTVAVGNDPFVLPAYQGTDVSFVFGITQAYFASQNVTIKMDGSAYALATDLDDVKNLQGSIGIAIDGKLKDYAKKDEVQNLIPDDIATTKNLADGDAETLKSAKEYADTQTSVKADDNKVVHTADMRKPASDVAGIDEVNAKADDSKVSILQTQVDNSAVGTNLIVQSGLKTGYLNRSDGGITGDASNFYSDNYIATNGETVFTFSSPDYAFKGHTNHSLAMYDSNKNYLGYQLITSPTQTLSKPNVAYIRFSINFTAEGSTNSNLSDWLSSHRYKLEKGSVATDWCPNPEDKVNVADMRKPANDVAGIEEVNAKQDKLDYTPANAANVVDRNPDTGVVSEPVDFTKLTVNGGKSVATSDDLKSLEASAWRELNFDVSQENYKAFSAAKIVYKINRDEKYISFFFAGTPSHVGNTSSNSTLVTDTTSLVMDLSSVLTEISGINFQTEYGQISDNNSHAASLGYVGAKVVFTSQVYISNILTGVTLLSKDYPDCRIYYTSLVNGI